MPDLFGRSAKVAGGERVRARRVSRVRARADSEKSRIWNVFLLSGVFGGAFRGCRFKELRFENEGR